MTQSNWYHHLVLIFHCRAAIFLIWDSNFRSLKSSRCTFRLPVFGTFVISCSWMIDWCLMPTVALFQLYHVRISSCNEDHLLTIHHWFGFLSFDLVLFCNFKHFTQFYLKKLYRMYHSNLQYFLHYIFT